MKEDRAAHLASALLEAFGMKLDMSAPSHQQAASENDRSRSRIQSNSQRARLSLWAFEIRGGPMKDEVIAAMNDCIAALDECYFHLQKARAALKSDRMNDLDHKVVQLKHEFQQAKEDKAHTLPMFGTAEYAGDL